MDEQNRRLSRSCHVTWLILLALVLVAACLSPSLSEWLDIPRGLSYFILVGLTFVLWLTYLRRGPHSRWFSKLYPGYSFSHMFTMDYFAWLVLWIAMAALLSEHIHQCDVRKLGSLWSPAIFGELGTVALRYVLIAVLVLFISTLYRRYEALMTSTQQVLASARETEADVRAVHDAVVPTLDDLKDTVTACGDLYRAAADILGAGTVLAEMPALVRKHRAGDLAHAIAEFTADMRKYLEDIYRNMAQQDDKEDEYDQNYLFRLRTFLPLAQWYLSVERLSFSGPYGYELRTSFVYYALVVAATVRRLEKAQPDTYEYFTILPKSFSQFFNLANAGTTLKWSTDFLECFCRKFIASKGIPYTRHFLAKEGDPKGWARLPKVADVPFVQALSEDAKDQILVTVESGSAKAATVFKESVIGTLEDVFPQTAIAHLSSIWRHVHFPSYCILNADDHTALVKAWPRFDTDYTCRFQKVYDALNLYHAGPEYIKVHGLSLAQFESCFRRAGKAIPHELFAVREKASGKWMYCIGMFEEAGQGARVQVYMPGFNPSNSKQASWNDICTTLEKLFGSSQIGTVKTIDEFLRSHS